jgi:hypothetical protein
MKQLKEVDSGLNEAQWRGRLVPALLPRCKPPSTLSNIQVPPGADDSSAAVMPTCNPVQRPHHLLPPQLLLTNGLPSRAF